ncbi:cytochrome c/c1 heme lyase [Colletotrichum kahawae]|uniref:Holocytochrome c-type synthase n=1 Tax=Colletotrichum kahawae TaxID=34407 RepID=A0AAD9Y9J7_COLKA|nr:cytochrome c/c1 heme lyase [Colletotrichum kahawae]
MSTATTDLPDLILLTQPTQPPPAKMADPKDGETCPVDHKAREAWLQHARAAAPNDTAAAAPPAPPHPIPNQAPPSQSWTHLAPASSRRQRQRHAPAAAPHPHEQPPPALPPQPQTSPQATTSWTQTLRSYVPFTSSPPPPPPPARPPTGKSPLDTYREVSTIPRTSTPSYPYDAPSPASAPPPTLQSSHGAPPSNNEQETGADAATGNWVYPSEKMFFDAMKRKGHDTRAADMRTVVPIHNAVNERAWKEIKEWEAPYTQGTACDGPRLHSFAGLSTNMSPKARLNTLLGYQAPVDRHDWVIDRCGVQVDYVIDFYAGRPDAQGKPSFYLDVRPKLNSWEGVKMRALRGAGLA